MNVNDILKQDIFFFVTTVAVTVFTIFLLILIVKMIRIVSKVERILDDLSGLRKLIAGFGNLFKKAKK